MAHFSIFDENLAIKIHNMSPYKFNNLSLWHFFLKSNAITRCEFTNICMFSYVITKYVLSKYLCLRTSSIDALSILR